LIELNLFQVYLSNWVITKNGIMKATTLLLIAMLFGITGFAQVQDSTGLEGDNLDLNGVMELFKESESVEDFEKKLNTEENGVNNLDLNEDGEVDYIKVIDHADSSSHALALQVDVSEDEAQDVAVIEMDEVDKETVNLQIIGDEELYGEDYIIEPADERDVNVVVNVWSWRPVMFIYGPRYKPWVSPWRWRVYPTWYHPWRRVTWAVYHPRVIRYHRPWYRRVSVRRCHRAHTFYRARRVHSPVFYKRHHVKHKTVKTGAPNKQKVKATKPTSKKQSSNRKRPGGTINKNKSKSSRGGKPGRRN
jgi:hypothetical protein